MISTALVSILTFISTEIDDIIVLFILFSRTKNSSEKTGVVLGKYLGLALVVLCSSIFASYISKIPSKYIGFLGFVPIAIGVKTFFEKDSDDAEKTSKLLNSFSKDENAKSILTYMSEAFLITLACSGDNFAIYIPFFTSLQGLDFLTMSIVFILMQALWIFIALRFVNTSFFKKISGKYYKIIIPVLFLLLGIYILIKAGTVAWIIGK